MALQGSNMRTAEKNEHDFYQTLPCMVKCLCHHLDLKGNVVLDAGSGTGVIANILRENNPRALVLTSEKHSAGAEVHMPVFDFDDPGNAIKENTFPTADHGDFFDVYDNFDYIISNPPYFLKNEFMEHALRLSTHVFMLFPLQVINYIEFCENWLDNDKYCGRITMYPKVILNPQGDFLQGGTTGYGWFHWSNLPPDPNDSQKYEVIDDIRKYI